MFSIWCGRVSLALMWCDHIPWPCNVLCIYGANLRPLYQIENKKGESLVHLDHVLDMVGHGWAWSGFT